MDYLRYWTTLVIDGVAFGSVYGLMALAIVMLYRANKLFNWAQTEIAMFFVCLGASLLTRIPFFIAVSLILGLSFLGGALFHAAVMRPITERRHVLKSHEAVITIGFLTFFNSLNVYLFGDDSRPFPSPFGEGSFTVYGVEISKHSLGVLATVTIMAFCVYVFYKFTRIGLVFEAVSENVEAARLRGIRSSNFLALAWGLSVMTSAIGAVLIAPMLTVSPSMLISVLTYALMSVVIGGMESPFGGLVGGVIVGVTENLSANVEFIGTDLKLVAVILVVVTILTLKPRGLWGRAEARRV